MQNAINEISKNLDDTSEIDISFGVCLEFDIQAR